MHEWEEAWDAVLAWDEEVGAVALEWDQEPTCSVTDAGFGAA